MTQEQFCYWLQGFAELNEIRPTQEQWQSIREHLNLVFRKVTPPVAPITPAPILTPEDAKRRLGLQMDLTPRCAADMYC